MCVVDKPMPNHDQKQKKNAARQIYKWWKQQETLANLADKSIVLMKKMKTMRYKNK